jgi:hypothetical protein
MTTAERRTPTRLAVRGLVTASMLAVGILLLGTAPVEAGPIACGYGDNWGESGDDGCAFLSSEGGTQTTQYQWDDYFLELTLFNVGASFDITITDNVMSNEEFQNRLSESLGGYTCIPLVDGSDGCRDFFFDVPDREGDDFTRWTNYALTIDWLSWLGNPDVDPTRIRLLHNIGSIPGNGYDEDMCEQAANQVPNYIPCRASTDPFITSGDTDFQSFTPALAPVPEPATLLLFGIGASGVLYRRLRRA